MEQTFAFKSAYSEELVGTAVTAAPEKSAQSRLHEDVLTHLTKSAVTSVSETLHLGLSEDTSKSTATWIVRAAKSVPLFCPAGRGLRAATVYGSAAALYGASEVKWGDSAENMGKDAVLGSLKGIGLKGSMDFIGAKMHGAGIDKKFWAAPAQGVAFGITGTATEVGLSRSTYHDEKGKFQGIGYGLAKTVEATANVQNLAIGAATFTLGAGGMKLLQTSAIAKAAPGLVGNRIFQNSFTGFSFGAFSGMAEEAQKQVVEGKFSGWELHRFDYGKIGKHGLFAASADAFGAAIGAKVGLPKAAETQKPVENKGEETPGAQKPAEDTIQRTVTSSVETANIQPAIVESVNRIAKSGEPTADAVLAAENVKSASTVESVTRIDQPSGQIIKDQTHLNTIVEEPLRQAVSNLWEKNIKTVGSGILERTERDWFPLGPSVHLGEYQPPYYTMKLREGELRKYEPVDDARLKVEQKAKDAEGKQFAYIVLDERTLSVENALIAREIGRFRTNRKVEIQVPVEPGTPAQQVEQAMSAIADKFKPQPMTWGFQSPLQFYRQATKAETGIPTQEWIERTVSSPEFQQQGLHYDREHNLIFQSKQLADKYNAATPAEPTWYIGPEIFGHDSRGGWRQGYVQSSIHLYTPEGQGLKRPTPETARMPQKDFSVADLLKPENAEYYLASQERFFELFGTKAFETIADRHWLEMRNKAFESVEKHWPAASVEKDRAVLLGATLFARAAERHGYIQPEEAGFIKVAIPEYLWRTPDGLRLTPEEVLHTVNSMYYDIFNLRNQPFDHNFAKQLIDRMNAPEGDNAYDKNQFRMNKKRSLESILENGLEMQIHPKYAPLLKEIQQKQSEGQIPERFISTPGKDGHEDYTPVYRAATQEERVLPLSELVKNLKIIDYGFKNKQGPILNKVSLASHDVHDHARAFWLLEQAGLFSEKADGSGYHQLMGKLSDPQRSNIFRREGELVASVAYDWRNYFDLHPQYEPQVSLKDVRRYFMSADAQGIPLSKNQQNALAYVEELMAIDPQGQSPAAKKLRHIIGGVWQETLEQKRKTDNSLWQRSDGTYQRMSATNPEYLAFVIDATRILQNHEPMMSFALNQNNLKIEKYLQDTAASSGDTPVPALRFTPEDVKTAIGNEPIVPSKTREWLMQHPGFNTRRAPIRNWMIGQQSEFDAFQIAMATWEQELKADHQRWIREQLFRDRFDLD